MEKLLAVLKKVLYPPKLVMLIVPTVVFSALIGIVNKCAVEEYPKSQAAIPPVPPVRIFDGGSPCGLKLFTRMVL